MAKAGQPRTAMAKTKNCQRKEKYTQEAWCWRSRSGRTGYIAVEVAAGTKVAGGS